MGKKGNFNMADNSCLSSLRLFFLSRHSVPSSSGKLIADKNATSDFKKHHSQSHTVSHLLKTTELHGVISTRTNSTTKHAPNLLRLHQMIPQMERRESDHLHTDNSLVSVNGHFSVQVHFEDACKLETPATPTYKHTCSDYS